KATVSASNVSPGFRAVDRPGSSHESLLPQIAKDRDYPAWKCPDGESLPFFAHIVIRDERQALRTRLNTLTGFHCFLRPVFIGCGGVERSQNLLDARPMYRVR